MNSFSSIIENTGDFGIGCNFAGKPKKGLYISRLLAFWCIVALICDLAKREPPNRRQAHGDGPEISAEKGRSQRL